MKNKGIGLFGIILILIAIAVILLIMGKIDFKDFILFPFYLVAGCFGVTLCIGICVALLVGIIWLIFKILDKYR